MPTPSPKHDTQFLSEATTPGLWSELVTDLSQYGVDFVDASSYGWLSSGSSSRFALSADGLNVGCAIEINTDSFGYAFCMTSSGLVRLGLVVTAGGNLQLWINHAVAATLALPDIEKTARDYAISLSIRPNLLTTGSGDAYISELRAWNRFAGSVAGLTAIHAVPVISSCQVVYGARNSSGTSTLAFATYLACAFSNRAHSTAEAYRDWIASGSSGTFAGSRPIEIPTPDRASGFGAAGQLVGPIYAMAAASTRANSLLTAAPIINDVFVDAPADLTADFADEYEIANFLGHNGYTANLAYLYLRPVPRSCNYLKVRAFVQIVHASEDNYQLSTRVYSMSRLPTIGGILAPGEEAPPPLTYEHQQEDLLEAHQPGVDGDWIEFDPLRIVRTSDGDHTVITLAFDPSDPELNGDLAGAEFYIHALTVEPLQLPPSGIPDQTDE